MFNKYPYTDFHELNLDWFLAEFKTLQTNFTTLTEAVEAFKNYVTSYLDNLDVQEEINHKIDQMVESGAFADLLSPVVADQIGPVVGDQIGDVVSSQIGPVVSDQIGGVVEEQLPDVIAGQVTGWLNENVDPVGSAVVVDTTLTISGAAADAKVTGAARTFSSRSLTPIKPKWNYGYKTVDGGTGGTSGTDRMYSDPMLCPAGSTVKYVGETNHQTIAGITFYDINQKFISGIANAGTIGTEQTATAPSGCWYCVISTKTTMKDTSYAKVDTSVVNTINNMNNLYNKKVFYIAPNGNDSTGAGTAASPFKSLNKALTSGAEVVHAAAGVYEQPPIATITKSGFRFYVDHTDPSASYIEKPKAIFENAYTLTVANDPDHEGLLVGSHTFSATSNWYKVFVSQTLPVSPTGTQTTTYNAILWESASYDESYDVKLVPRLTLQDCIDNAGSFYYDHSAGKVYINPTGTISAGSASYKYLRFESGSLVGIQNCEDVYIEGLEIKHAVDYDLVITNSNNVKLQDCIFTHAANRNGLQISKSVVTAENCEACKATGDGFGIATQGNGNFINCYSHDNYDDGISHHDGSVGHITGGCYQANGKAGIASPYSGSNVSVTGAMVLYNQYGFYAGNSAKRNMISGCTIAGNRTAGILNVLSTLYVGDCVFAGNTEDITGNGNTYEYKDGEIIIHHD